MVDSISGNSSSIQDNSLLHLSQTNAQTQVEKVNKEANRQTEGLTSLNTFDTATISGEAMKAYAKEKDALKFSRLAQRIPNTVDYEKVNRIKNLLDSGRINDYLRTVDTGSLAQSILDGPAGAFLG